MPDPEPMRPPARPLSPLLPAALASPTLAKDAVHGTSPSRTLTPPPKTPPPVSWSGMNTKNNAKHRDLENDPRYKKYVLLVERNLQSFDSVNEWADVNPFLSKIMRSFQAYPQFDVIPKKVTLAKRLAQCLNPALPAGVHGKTLDVYAYVLQTIGPDQLTEDITLYSYGLFPFLQNASLSVKPQLLDIYEKYYLPLKERLRPCLKSFMVALLPGLDEEGSEFFDRVLRLLDQLRKSVDETFFFQCMWLILITAPQHRGPALHYLSRRMPHLINTEDVAFVLGDDSGLMVRAFSATVLDSQVLVQRAMLDLMVVYFPISNGLIEQNDLTILVKAAVGVVLRKDMSLNRRLYAWLLGSSNQQQQQQQKDAGSSSGAIGPGGKQLKVFEGPAKMALIAGLQSLLFSATDELVESQKPYRVFVSLLDEWNIGYPVIQEVFLDALISLKGHVESGQKHSAELVHSATIWIDMTDPYLIWKKLNESIQDGFPAKNENIGSGTPGSAGSSFALDLVIFFLTTFQLNDEEMQHMHMPMFLLILLTKLKEVVQGDDMLAYASQVERALVLCLILLQRIPVADFAPLAAVQRLPQPGRAPKSKSSDNKQQQQDSEAPVVVTFDGTSTSAKEYIENFYSIAQRGPGQQGTNSNNSNKEYTGIRGEVLTKQALALIQDILQSMTTSCIQQEDPKAVRAYRGMIESSCSILSIVSRHLIHGPNASTPEHFSGPWLESLRDCCCKVDDFVIVDAAITIMIELTMKLELVPPSFLDNRVQMPLIVGRLWTFLADEYMHLHLRASQLLWLLQGLTESSHQVETAVASYLVIDNAEQRVDAFQKFGVFWRLSDEIRHCSTAFVRPMMLMLDSLGSTNPSNRRAGETWIRSNLKSYSRLLDPLLLVLFDESIVRMGAEESFHNEYFSVYYYIQNFNQAQVQYVYNTLLTVFRFGGLGFLRSIRQATIPPEIVAKMTDTIGSFTDPKQPAYLDGFIRCALRYIESEPTADNSKQMMVMNAEIQMTAADFLHFIVSKIDHVDTGLLALIHKTVIDKMLFCINHNRLDLQSRLLHLLHATILMGTSPIKKPPSGPPNGIGGREGSVMSFDGNSNPNSSGGGNSSGQDNLFRHVGSSPLFVKTIFDALSVPTNRPILQHWMDFIMLALPFLTNYYRRVLQPVIQCICDQMLRCRISLLESYADNSSNYMRNNRSIPPTPTTPAPGSAGGPGTTTPPPAPLPKLTDQDLMIFLTGLERLLTFSLSEARLGEDVDSVHKQEWSDGYRGTQGAVANVLNIEMHSSDSFQENKARDTVLYNIIGIVQILVEIYSVFDKKSGSRTTLANSNNNNHSHMSTTEDISFQFVGERVKNKVKKILSGLYKAYSSEITEAFVELFLNENPTALDISLTSSTSVPIPGPGGIGSAKTDQPRNVDLEYRTLDILSLVQGASPLAVLLTLLDSIRSRTAGMATTRSKRVGLRISKTSDAVLLRFLELYCGYLPSAETLIELWPLCLNFVREYFPQATNFKYAFPSLLRIMSVLCDRLSYTVYFEDKKIRRDCAELYQRVLDYCILISGRAFDQGLFMRNRNPQDLEILEESDDSKEYAGSINIGLVNEKGNDGSGTPLGSMNSGTTIAASEVDISVMKRGMGGIGGVGGGGGGGGGGERGERAAKTTKEEALIQQTLISLSQLVIPSLRRILQEQDRVIAVLTNLMYYVVGPTLKVSRPGAFSTEIALELLSEMSKIPFAYRTWRKEVWEAFLDSRFFTMGPGSAKKWRTILQAAMTMEKERLAELLGRISTSPSSTLFTSRDQESLNRALMLRRLTFVIWCGTKDQYLPQLPNIQEKLVELLKLNSTEQVHPEIYLCLRVLLCRITSQHLTNFWPVLLTELIQLFSVFLSEPPPQYGSMLSSGPGSAGGTGSGPGSAGVGGQTIINNNNNSNINSADRQDQVNLFLAACKFLDLLFVVENGTYFIHQWIFISDAIRKNVMSAPMGEAVPHALMDRLGKKLFEEAPLDGYHHPNNQHVLGSGPILASTRDHLDASAENEKELMVLMTNAVISSNNSRLGFASSQQSNGGNNNNNNNSSSGNIGGGGRFNSNIAKEMANSPATAPVARKRPMLTMRTIQNVHELEFFLTHVADYVYQTTYTLAKPDGLFIENLIERDMLGGGLDDRD